MPQIRKIVKADYGRRLSWFRLRRYEIERIMNFSHYDWALQIAYRMDLIDRARQWHTEEWNQFHLEDNHDIAIGKRLYHAFKVIQVTPIVSFAKLDPGFINAWDFPTLFPLLYSRDGCLSIRPLTISEYYLHEYELDFNALQYSREFFRGSDLFKSAVEGKISPTTFARSAKAEFRNRWEDVCIWSDTYSGHKLPYKKLLNDPVHRHTRPNAQVLLTVDPKAPDKQIHDQLDLVLKRLRWSAKTIPRVKFNPNSWIESGLLPYFDLYVWAAIENLSRPPVWLAQEKCLYECAGLPHTIAAVTHRTFRNLTQGQRPLWGALLEKAVEQRRA